MTDVRPPAPEGRRPWWLAPALLLAAVGGFFGGWWGALLCFLVLPVYLALASAAANVLFIACWCGLAGSRERFRRPRFWALSLLLGLLGMGLAHLFAGPDGVRSELRELLRGFALGAALLPGVSFVAGWPRGWRLMHGDGPGSWGYR